MAKATGGTELLYQFYVHDGTAWKMVQDYSPANTFAWRPTVAGDYKISVYVKDKNSTNAVDALKQIGYRIN